MSTNKCGYTWKQNWANRLLMAFVRLIEGGERHPAAHHCVRDAGHDANPASAVHMCNCTTTHWAGRWRR